MNDDSQYPMQVMGGMNRNDQVKSMVTVLRNSHSNSPLQHHTMMIKEQLSKPRVNYNDMSRFKLQDDQLERFNVLPKKVKVNKQNDGFFITKHITPDHVSSGQVIQHNIVPVTTRVMGQEQDMNPQYLDNQLESTPSLTPQTSNKPNKKGRQLFKNMRYPCKGFCDRCRETSMTITSLHCTCRQWMYCSLLSLTGCVWFSCVPFVHYDCYNIRHNCGVCGKYIGQSL
eukprot:403355369